MEKYFDEAIKSKENLRIRTANNKIFNVKIVRYTRDKVFYIFSDSNKQGSIYKTNILDVEFSNTDKQRDFVRSLSNYCELINKFSDYYMDCLKKSKTKILYKEELFQNIFDLLYSQDDNNLLIKYFLGDMGKYNKLELADAPLLVEKSNDSQRTAIKNGLNNIVSVIEGPPGTGKTTTILSLIVNLIKQDKKVVVVSKNNTAVDNIIEEFKKINLPEFYIRYGDKTVMDELLVNADNHINKFKNQVEGITIDRESLDLLKKFQRELNILEPTINELIDLKNFLFELKTQKKFIDRRNDIYKFKNNLSPEEIKIICNKNANIKTINRLIALSHKQKYNFFEKLLIRYKFSLNGTDINKKLQSIINLLEQLYVNKEIANKEHRFLSSNLEDKQNKVEKIYNHYVELSLIAFKNYLKENIKFEWNNISSKNELIDITSRIYPLILTTADGFLFNFKNILKSNKQIDTIIIDEASQCDVLTGIPLLFLAKQIIVVGDSKQLSAIVDIKPDKEINENYAYENNTFLNSIKKVFSPPIKVLLEHYRCNYNIINFCNKYYYDNELKIYTNGSNDSISIIDANKYKGTEKLNGSYINKREVKTIEKQISDISNTFIITPFKEQADLFKSKYNKETCGTIHSFQGKGTDNVYFSAVFSDLDFCRKHVKGKCNIFTKELMNVAVSRAKQKFILVCNKDFFVKNGKNVPDVKNLIDYIEIYGEKIFDNSVCIFDYLYKNIKYYKSSEIFDNEYEEKLYISMKKILEKSNYDCYPKLNLVNLVQNKEFLNQNPKIMKYILNGAHADFTIFDTRINKPILVVELDGKFHADEKQVKNDSYKDIALKKSGIEILRIPSKDAITEDELKEKLFKFIEFE